MTDTALLREIIERSGFKIRYIAEVCGLTYNGLLNKINGKTEFTTQEIITMTDLLRISPTEAKTVFFADL